MDSDQAKNDKHLPTADDNSLPRVSLVMLAYNQECYIEQAVAGAIAQDYPNLEIVLSDDGSSDATFEIIERIAGDYAGPHSIIVNRTPTNSGILSHLYHAVSRSSGRLIVTAAGDDVSIPERVSTLVKHWRETGAAALSSEWFVMDERGQIIGQGSRASTYHIEARWFLDRTINMISGATAAYDRRVFEAITLPDFPILAEDYFFSLVLRIRGQTVVYVGKPLVSYRAHAQSIINRPLAINNVLEEERRLEQYSATVVRVLDHVITLAKTGQGIDQTFGTSAPLRWRAIHAQKKYYAFRSSWIGAPVWLRLASAMRPPYAKAKFRWLLPRIGGITTLRLQRRITTLIRRIT